MPAVEILAAAAFEGVVFAGGTSVVDVPAAVFADMAVFGRLDAVSGKLRTETDFETEIESATRTPMLLPQ